MIKAQPELLIQIEARHLKRRSVIASVFSFLLFIHLLADFPNCLPETIQRDSETTQTDDQFFSMARKLRESIDRKISLGAYELSHQSDEPRSASVTAGDLIAVVEMSRRLRTSASLSMLMSFQC